MSYVIFKFGIVQFTKHRKLYTQTTSKTGLNFPLKDFDSQIEQLIGNLKKKQILEATITVLVL